ncbi:MAG TPA: hypothetical protein VGU26_01655 [Gaiellaceae bacterium]|nr:hypothetical protein [Gaiellaceae bacterium]
MGTTAPYRFDELGWLQFDRLCADVLDVGAGWTERDFGRVALVSEGVLPPAGGSRLEAPTLVIVAWLRPRESRSWLLRRIVKRELDQVAAASALVVTNAETFEGEPMPVRIVHVGPSELSGLLDARADLRLRVPSVLGIRALDELIPEEVIARSTADVGAATELARVFVPTGAYVRALDVLEARRFAVLVGPPEMGKTAIARMTALAQMTAGWEAHECIRPDQLWAAFARDRPQVFIADDAFGSTEYRPDAADRWALELPHVLRALDDRHWLIWTSRPAPLRAGLRRVHREHGLERFPQPAEVQVDAAALDVGEKALILFRHARAAPLTRPAVRLIRSHGWTIVSHAHFTPERIRRFVRHRLPALAAEATAAVGVAAAVDAEIREPTRAMAASFAALPAEHRVLLLALLDAPPEPVPERALAAAVRRHSETGFTRTPSELVDRLSDHFVRVVPPTSVAWVHPSWRDLLITQLAAEAHARSRFLERCSLHGVLLALSTAGGAAGERLLPLLREDRDWDTLAARVDELAPDLDDASTTQLLEALGTALAADLSDWARAEAVALAAATLERLARMWDDSRATLSVSVLEAWFALAAGLLEPPRVPSIDRTWIELVPTEPVDPASRLELVRLDEWLALADVLRTYVPHELDRFGFPARYYAVFAAFLAAAERVPEEAEALVSRILRGLRRLAPALDPETEHVTDVLAARNEPWFEVRFETHPRRSEPAFGDRAFVTRVLRDLG